MTAVEVKAICEHEGDDIFLVEAAREADFDVRSRRDHHGSVEGRWQLEDRGSWYRQSVGPDHARNHEHGGCGLHGGVWPLNSKGELLNWTIVESKAGVAKIREIAAVKGIGVLFPGAGTLRGVYSTQDSTGRRVNDDAAWEAALQQVLAACKEFNVACGFPANDPATMEMRYKQGFSVFVIGWGESGFKTVEAGVALRK